MTEIGYQHGIVAGMNGLRDLDPSKTLLKKEGGKWPSIDTLEQPLDQWKAWDKMERAFTILVYDHDAALAGGGAPNPPDPPPGLLYLRVAPRVAYKAGNSDARYCCTNQPGVWWDDNIGRWRDDVATYDDNGLCTDGKRSDGDATNTVTSSLEIDGREYCLLPTQGDPTKNTGSWVV